MASQTFCALVKNMNHDERRRKRKPKSKRKRGKGIQEMKKITKIDYK